MLKLSPPRIRYLAGVDISPPDDRGLVKAAAVVVSYPELEPAMITVAMSETCVDPCG